MVRALVPLAPRRWSFRRATTAGVHIGQQEWGIGSPAHGPVGVKRTWIPYSPAFSQREKGAQSEETRELSPRPLEGGGAVGGMNRVSFTSKGP